MCISSFKIMSSVLWVCCIIRETFTCQNKIVFASISILSVDVYIIVRHRNIGFYGIYKPSGPATTQGLRVSKFRRIPVFQCLTNLDHSSLLYLHSCLDTRNVVFINANKPTTRIPQFSTALVIQLDAHALLMLQARNDVRGIY